MYSRQDFHGGSRSTEPGDAKIRLSIGPLFGDDRYHDYFYGVGDADATAARPAYDADGGYSGMRSEFTYSKGIGDYRLGGFVRYDNMNGAVIDDSPLVSDDETWTVGVGLAWVFYQRWVSTRPEFPEVETTRRGIEVHVCGATCVPLVSGC